MMWTFNKHYAFKQEQQGQSLVLQSFDDFNHWFRNCCDLSIFDEQEVFQALWEEQPEAYPCIPLITMDGQTIFLTMDLITHWFNTLEETG